MPLNHEDNVQIACPVENRIYYLHCTKALLSSCIAVQLCLLTAIFI